MNSCDSGSENPWPDKHDKFTFKLLLLHLHLPIFVICKKKGVVRQIMFFNT